MKWNFSLLWVGGNEQNYLVISPLQTTLTASFHSRLKQGWIGGLNGTTNNDKLNFAIQVEVCAVAVVLQILQQWCLLVGSRCSRARTTISTASYLPAKWLVSCSCIQYWILSAA